MATISKPTAAVTGIFGTAGDDYLLGTSGDDTIIGGVAGALSAISYTADNKDTMEGGAGDDKYIVNDATDTIIELIGEGIDTVFTSVSYTLAAELENIVAAVSGITITGNAKDNILDGQQEGTPGEGTLVGGAGNDTYYLSANDKVTESSGIDTVIAGFTINLTAVDNFTNPSSAAAIENVTLSGSTDGNITGNALNNRLSGDSTSNNILGGAGNDILDTGAGGTDVLDGGAGNDTYIIRADVSATVTDTGGGVDNIKSFATVTAGAGIENVTLLGALVIDAIGNTSNNVLIGNSNNNTLTGDDGNDTLIGAAGIDQLNGGNGNDSLDGGDGGDTLNGNAGNDTLIGGAGTNGLNGGTGNDTYILTNAGDTVTENSNAGTDTVKFGGTTGTLTVASHIESIILTDTTTTNDILVTAASSTTNIKMTGNNGEDTLTGGSGNDSLSGGNGDDSLSGGEGNDTLVGGAGTNTLRGDAGNDVYVVTASTNTINSTSEAAGAAGGIDTLQYSGTDTAVLSVTNIEKVTLSGAGNLKVTVANASGVSMIGNSGSNSLTGGNGNDTISGGIGSDTLDGGNKNDILDGGAGTDEMRGGAGKDTYFVDNVGDTITGESASIVSSESDTVQINLAANAIYVIGGSNAANVETFLLQGTAAVSINASTMSTKVSLTGNGGINTLTGGAIGDVLSGAAGNDSIVGGTGDDTIIGGIGRDDVEVTSGTRGASESNTIKFAAGATDTKAATNSISGIDLYSDLKLDADSSDLVDLSVVVANVGTVVSGTVDAATFIDGMNTLLRTTDKGFVENTKGIDAAVVSVTGGTLDNKDFLVVDLDGSDTFTVSDFVIEITGSSFAAGGGLTVDSFI